MKAPKKVVVDYQVFGDISPYELSKQISAMLADGWTLHKGLAMAVENGKPFYAQAVVRKEFEDDRGAWG